MRAIRRGWFCCISALATSSVFPAVPTDRLLADYVARFNRDDVESVTNAIPNSAATEFMLKNCPRFACPDAEIERTYYFRWWTFRKHLRHDLGLWTVTEFLPNVGWAGKGNTIVCPTGHHFREGRWLRDPEYLADNARFWLQDPEARRWDYSSWLFTSVRLLAEISGRDRLPEELLDDAVACFRRWEEGFKRGGAFMGGDGAGGFLSIDGYEGTEISLGGSCGYKPLFSSAMWSEANAIAEVARACGRTELAREFDDKAKRAFDSVMTNCWNGAVGFFTTRTRDGRRNPVRELHGYAPWYFGFPSGKTADWAQLDDPQGFSAKYGLTFPERRAKGFTIDYRGHECKWNGPSWPFATSIALTALANDLHARHVVNGGKGFDGLSDLFGRLVHQYADSHCRVRDEKREGVGGMVAWIDENLNPDRRDWIARSVLLEGFLKKNSGGCFRERGKDYNHSTFCDLVISGLVGIVPRGSAGFDVDPLCPRTWDRFVLENLRYREHEVAVLWRCGEGLEVRMDGEVAARRTDLGVLNVRFRK